MLLLATMLTMVLSPRAESNVGTSLTPTPSPTPSCSPPCFLPVILSENFDNVSPPALPPDWQATNAQGPPPAWVTSNSGAPIPPADTSPNAASIDDPAVVSDKRLDSLQLLSVPGESPQLTFRHNFNLEASDADPNLGFDGGVLEVSTDGGKTFQDVLTAGGSFAMGGYNRTISTDRGSPIAGRQAWSGNSGGFMTTVVTMPFAGPNEILRWRMVSDTTGSGEGWRLDTVIVTECALVPCETPTPPATPSSTTTPSVTQTPRPIPTRRPRPTPLPRPTPPG